MDEVGEVDMRKFTDIPTPDFPLNVETYRRLRDEIETAADRFDYLGTTDGYNVSCVLTDVRVRLDEAWQLILRIEQHENGR